MQQNVIKYTGDNTELFRRVPAENLDPDARIIVPETHNAIFIKDGILMDTLNSGSYEVSRISRAGSAKTARWR